MVLRVVPEFLGWSQRDVEDVNSQELDEPLSFDRHVLGKDAVDALFMTLVEDGVHKVVVKVHKKQARRRFDAWLFEHERVRDRDQWTIGRRLAAWQSKHKVQLIEL